MCILDQMSDLNQNILKDIIDINKNFNFPIYLVGGIVRDLYLGVSSLDLDFVIEGINLEIAREFSILKNGTLKEYPMFLTASVIFDKRRIDFATSREEKYEMSGDYPKVKATTIKSDLKRRDFSINAMAISLNTENYGSLLDPMHGLEDLKAKKIRVLHNQSFKDDPTRIFRAARFSARFGFEVEHKTLELIKNAVEGGAVSTLTKYRIKQELQKIEQEANPEGCMNRLRQWGVSAIINSL